MYSRSLLHVWCFFVVVAYTLALRCVTAHAHAHIHIHTRTHCSSSSSSLQISIPGTN